MNYKTNLIIFFFLCGLTAAALAVPGVEVFIPSPDTLIPFSPVVGDLDNDGHPEIVIAYKAVIHSEGKGRIKVVRKHPDNTVEELWDKSFGRACFTPVIGDVDGDGIGEIFCNVCFDSSGQAGVICIEGPTGNVKWSKVVGGYLRYNVGHELLLADFDNDGTIEVVSQMNRSGYHEIIAFDALNGDTVGEPRIDTGEKYAYASMACEDINDDGRNELVAAVTQGGTRGDVEVVVWDNTGAELWRRNGGPPAVADMDLDGEAEIACGWVQENIYGYPYHLYVYSGDGELEREFTAILSLSTSHFHYECPVIANFDPATPEPEIAFAVNHVSPDNKCRITVKYIDGTTYWRTPDFAEGEIISMSAADLNCDGIPDLCSYNMIGKFIVFDGASGDFWAEFGEFKGGDLPDPSRFIAIADVDYDCHAEFLVSTYQSSYPDSIPRGVYIYGDDEDWNPVRRCWNTGSYYYTNVDNDLGLLSNEVSNQHWKVDNIWRAQRVVSCGLEIVILRDNDTIKCAGCDTIGQFDFAAKFWNPTCSRIAEDVHAIIEFDSTSDSCLTLISGAFDTRIGEPPGYKLYPESDTVLHWTFEVNPLCDTTEFSFWIHLTCTDSQEMVNRHIKVTRWTPRCHYPPGVIRVRPALCGNVIACGPSDSGGQELLYNVSADTIYGLSYPLDFESITLTVESNTTSREDIRFSDPRIGWSGDDYGGILFYKPDPMYPHGDTVVFRISEVYNTLGCFTESAPCSFVIDDVPPDTIDVYPDYGTTVNYSAIDTFFAVMTDDFLDIAPESFSPENTSIIVDGVPITGYTVDGHFDGIDPDTVFFTNFPNEFWGGESADVCIWGTYDSVDDTNLCGPNRTPLTCWRLYIQAEPPRASVIHPRANTFSACRDQKIIFEIESGVPIDTMSIELEIDSVIHTITEDWLYFDTDSDWLYWVPDAGWWQSGNQANVCLKHAKDRDGQEFIEAPLCFDFWLDFDPPIITFVYPRMGMDYMIQDQEPTLVVRVEDPLSGPNPDSVLLWVESDSIGIPPADLARNNRHRYTLQMNPGSNTFEFTPSDTFTVTVRACDNPDYCAANCTTVIDSFIIEPDIACIVFPNPFTPGNDDINEYTVFNYPHMYTEQAELHIYDVRNREVFGGNIGPITNIVEYFRRNWNGRDKDGRLLPEGLYIYVIVIKNQMVCNGTVVIAR